MDHPCRKCGKKQLRQVYRVIAGHKLEAQFCQECYNKWFDVRDKVVEEAFREYIKTK